METKKKVIVKPSYLQLMAENKKLVKEISQLAIKNVELEKEIARIALNGVHTVVKLKDTVPF